MKKLIQQLILILTLAAFALTLPGCGGAEEAPILPEEGNEADEPDSGGGGGDGGDGGDGELEGDSGGGDGA